MMPINHINDSIMKSCIIDYVINLTMEDMKTILGEHWYKRNHNFLGFCENIERVFVFGSWCGEELKKQLREGGDYLFVL